MRFACPSCKTRYRIDDGKLAGKILQIRCKRCDVVISVQDPQMAGGSSTVSIVEPPEPEKIWYAGINAKRVGPMTLGGMEQQIRYGRVQFTTLIWKSPMPQWIPAGDIPDLRRMLDQYMLSQMPSPPPFSSAEVEGREEELAGTTEEPSEGVRDDAMPAPQAAFALGPSDEPHASIHPKRETGYEEDRDVPNDLTTAVDWRMPQSLEEAREVPRSSRERESVVELPDATTVDLLPTVVPQLLDRTDPTNTRPEGEPPKRRSVETPRVLPSVLVGTPASDGTRPMSEPKEVDSSLPHGGPTSVSYAAGAEATQTDAEPTERYLATTASSDPPAVIISGPVATSEEVFATEIEPEFVPAESFPPESAVREPVGFESDVAHDSMRVFAPEPEAVTDAVPLAPTAEPEPELVAALAAPAPEPEAAEAIAALAPPEPEVEAAPIVEPEVAIAPPEPEVEAAAIVEPEVAIAPEPVAALAPPAPEPEPEPELVAALAAPAPAPEPEPEPELVAALATPAPAPEPEPEPELVAALATPAPEPEAAEAIAALAPPEPEVVMAPPAAAPEVEDTPILAPETAIAPPAPEPEPEAAPEPEVEVGAHSTSEAGVYISLAEDLLEAAEKFSEPIDVLADVHQRGIDTDESQSALSEVEPESGVTSVDALSVLNSDSLNSTLGAEVEAEKKGLQSNLAAPVDSIDSATSQNDGFDGSNERPVFSAEVGHGEHKEEDEAANAWIRTDLSEDESQDAYAAVATQKMLPYDRQIEEALEVNSSEGEEPPQSWVSNDPAAEIGLQSTTIEEDDPGARAQAENAVFVEESSEEDAIDTTASPDRESGAVEVEREQADLAADASAFASDNTPLSPAPESLESEEQPGGHTPTDAAHVELPASERITSTEKSVEMSPTEKIAADDGLDDFDDFFNNVPQEFQDAAIEAEATVEERPTRQDKKFLREQMKEGHRTLIEVGGVKEPTAKEKEALRKEFEVVRKLEEETKKKKRNLFLAGLVTAFVVVCAVLYGSGDFSVPTEGDYRADAPRPDFANQAPVPIKKKGPNLEEEAVDDVEEEETEPVSVKKTRAARKSDGKEKAETVVRKRTIEEKAVENLKTMTADQLAAATREASGKSERLIDIAPPQVEVDRKKDLAAKEEREKTSKSPRLKEIQKRLKSRKTKMLKCKNGTEETVEVRLKIGATGLLSSLNVSNGAPGKKNCVAKELKKLVFPPGKSELSVKMRYIVP